MLVSAHYDHRGMRLDGDGDRIFNGANDDASGTAAVLALAQALRDIKPHRTLVFVACYGEEKGLLGSRTYAEQPVFPIAKTVANVNLEHIGRTDGPDGPHARRAVVTGFDYSDVPHILANAVTYTGVAFYRHPTNSGLFFSRSDNQALADRGVPAHTVSVGYLFPD